MKKIRSALTTVALIVATSTSAQIVVTGKVKDSQGALPQATIYTEDGKASVLTDNEGDFTITVPKEYHSIIIAYQGYLDKRIDLTQYLNDKTHDLGVVILASSTSNVSSIEEVMIVSAYKPSQARALNIKKNAATVSDVLAADAIGKLPDRNAAEAIQRLPAVTIERDMGEGRFASVRGTPIQWSSSTLNGNRMPSASGDYANRGLQMDIFPSELIQYVKLYKTLTPDLDGDAIGGTIDFITKSAVNNKTLSVNLSGGYVNQSQSPSYNASVVYGGKISDKLKFITSAVVWNRKTGTDRFLLTYDFNNPDYDKSFAINQLQLRDYLANRRTLGFYGALDYKINDKNKLYFKGLFSQYLDRQTVRENYFNFDSDNVQLQARHADYVTDLYNFTIGGEHDISRKLQVDWALLTSKSSFRFNSPKEFNKENRGYPIVMMRQQMTYGNRSSDGLVYLAMDSPNGVGSASDKVLPNTLEAMDPARTFLYQAIMMQSHNSERDYRGQINFKYKANEKVNLKLGGKYINKEKEVYSATLVYMPKALLGMPGGAPLVYLNQLELQSDMYSGGFLKELGEPYNNVLVNQITNSQIDEIFSPGFQKEHTMLQVQGKDAASNQAASYLGKENVYAFYIMGDVEVNDHLSIIGGVRNEYTISNFSGNKVIQNQEETTVEPVSHTNKYNAFLPMINLKYNFNANTILRAAYTRSYARADFSDLNPGYRINEATQTINEGNANLNPTFANSFDLMFEKYFKNLGIFSAGVFYKQLTDIIYSDQNLETINGVNYIKTSPKNLNDGWLLGFEVNLSKRFTKLPGILSHLGIEANYTYVDSKTSLPVFKDGKQSGTIETTLPKQAKHIFNVGIFYETNKLMVRLAGNYKGKYLNTIRSLAGPDHYQWFDKNFTLDATASYAFSKRLRVFLELNNITNEPNRFYHGEQQRTESVDYYGFVGQIGLSLNLF